MPLEELVGEFGRTVFHGDRDFVIGVLADETKVKGEAKPGMLVSGGSYRFFGKWENNNRYGRQFKFDHFIEDEPLTRHGVTSFLMRYGKRYGMTPGRAGTLYDAYKSECLRMIREEPATCAELLKGADVGKFRAFAADLANMRHSLHTKVELMALLDGKGFPKKLVEDLVEKWGGRATTVIKTDPFKLLTHRFKGAGFARVDTLYLSLGHDPARMKRQVLAAWNEIAKPGDGDTWIPASLAAEAVRKSIGGVESKPAKAIRIGIRSKLLAEQEIDGIKWVSTTVRRNSEAYLAFKVNHMRGFGLRWPEIRQGNLSPHQFGEVMKATATSVGLLVGTPGTGKTYSVAALLHELLHHYSPIEIAVCAPTGKAAVRCAELLKQQGVEIATSTIHSLLSPTENGHGGGNWRFAYNRSNPLPINVCIVDEASMVDTDLMADLFAALPPQCRVLLVGDPHQLPPVGHGAPLRDLVAHGVSVGQLDEVFRNAGLIVHGCRAIKDGATFRTAERFAGAEDNLVVFHAATEVEALDRLRSFYAQLVAQGKRDLFEDAQVLCPMNTKGTLCRTNCASIIQDIVNPRRDGDALVGVYRENDKIICLSNDNYSSADRQGLLYVANGEMGRVQKVEKGDVYCVFPPAGSGYKPREIVVNDKSDEFNAFALGYAITVHKSQGSQWPIVVVMADPSASRVASREWWYTALSRASERCVVIGDKNVVLKQARRAASNRRKTFLQERLAGVIASA